MLSTRKRCYHTISEFIGDSMAKVRKKLGNTGLHCVFMQIWATCIFLIHCDLRILPDCRFLKRQSLECQFSVYPVPPKSQFPQKVFGVHNYYNFIHIRVVNGWSSGMHPSLFDLRFFRVLLSLAFLACSYFIC